MARRQKKKQEVSLFPFLDILACVIGNLILIITAVVLEQVDTKPIAEAAEREAQKKQVEKDLQTVALLQQQLEKLKQENQSSDKRVQEAKARLEKAEKDKLAARAKLLETPPPPPPPDEKDIAKAKKMEETNEELLKAIDEIEAKIAEKKKVPERSITILPANKGAGIPKAPIFVELNAKTATLLAMGEDYENVFGDQKNRTIPVEQLGKSPDFQKLLKYVLETRHERGMVRNKMKTIITFLMRPDARDAYNRFVNPAVKAFSDQHKKERLLYIFPNGDKFYDSLAGTVPLPGDGEVDVGSN